MHGRWPARRSLLGAATGLTICWTGVCRAQAPAFQSATDGPAQAAAPATALAASADQANRLTVPVLIDGKGPFPFVVDTGADRTAISKELAASLRLTPGAVTLLHATSGDDLAQTAVLDTLKVGPRVLTRIQAPLLTRDALGAEGMLGIDSLADQTMVLDFEHGCVRVRASRHEAYDPDVIVVHGKNRYGQLILVDARVGRIPIYVILDTGAQNTVANVRLGDMLAIHDPRSAVRQPIGVISVLGAETPGEFRMLPEVTLGGATLHNVPVGVADLHTFARFGLQDQPAMLLGMDVLRLFNRVSVDFANRLVSLDMREATSSGTRVAVGERCG